MCNNYRLITPLDQIWQEFADLRGPLRFAEGAPNLERRDDIRITDRAPIVRMGREGPELAVRRWSWPGQGGKPVYTCARKAASSRRTDA